MPAKKISETGNRRPPIVTIMGHVDHGKTSLLDAIRHTKLTEKEFGGITQHIGAYQVEHQGKKITFIDTPGHAAFAKMRARGASVTDIVILVVAADDGVKPQTVESIKHIAAAKVPLIVAINKMDAPGAAPDMVKGQLTEHQVFCEGYGGQTPAVLVSARTGLGINDLLEMIVLLAEVEGLTGEASEPAEAVVIESKMDQARGAIATLIVRTGTMKVKADYYCEGKVVKIRSLISDLGVAMKEALPGTPVEVMGFTTVPTVGSMVTALPQATEALKPKEIPVIIPQDESAETEEKSKEPLKLNVILKADTAGTLEAIKQNISSELVVIASGVGEVNESEVMMADSTNASIIAFNVKVSSSAKKIAALEHVKIVSFTIIYELLEFLEEKVLKLLEPAIYEEEVGLAEVLATFLIKGDKIAGCSVKSGKLSQGGLFHVFRGDKKVKSLTIKSLKRGKEDILAAKNGTECGLVSLQPFDFRVGDMIRSYRIVES